MKKYFPIMILAAILLAGGLATGCSQQKYYERRPTTIEQKIYTNGTPIKIENQPDGSKLYYFFETDAIGVTRIIKVKVVDGMVVDQF